MNLLASTTEGQDLTRALHDVCQAYRLVADYQQRLQELLEYMRLRFGAEDYYYSYPYGTPGGNLSSPRSNPNVGKRFLPMREFVTLWVKSQQTAGWQNKQEVGDWMLAVKHVSDTSDTNLALSTAKSTICLQATLTVCVQSPANGCNWFHNLYIPNPMTGLNLHAKLPEEFKVYGFEPKCMTELASKEAVDQWLEQICLEASTATGHTIQLQKVGG